MSDTPVFQFATVGTVYEDGITLIFDGQEEASEKRYKCNTSVSFNAGDRVKIAYDSGTYVVEYVVGYPGSGGGGGSIDADTLNGKTEGQLSVAYAASSGSANSSNTATSANSATTATNATRLNNKQESALNVNSAYRLQNAYYAQGNNSAINYGIQIRRQSGYSGNFQIRSGTGAWVTIQTG